ncbi:acetyl-CoA carboxylase biotin carboxylase subunit [Gluconobacter cerinus]|uniref:acetyl-CoA carboxylase biotin carboxylase subunit n=1 Tax=Gluconobacter TaxID=441 RepID=UPI001B8AC011|nr:MULTISPECIES: acetyl-CoA carboxylase biotin carboxylase subunit [Gluconobacter]MBS1036022.1 acetyl-CoA carboxylase biotin carboxylase subunit [Gluconobacter cerinus]MBS1042101.1 acetyl-CoA carboxylase biotin carboxylase subunit [Gluconobacter cerinus]MBS1048680.1 acetyl-CoA carboxylase biotin carboxylase subunit [Gluconobacter cerinus]MBS1072934.1 acetyl-CoA carboxylase biotin carboxylase subunit [Gluconobacter cerinus]MCW2267097.1 acetyl-CoA carboxylase biotin carboxylase subunit [Gluconob
MRDIRRVMIANRGEIALRIVRACRLLGLETVGIYSDVDADLPHLRLMDQSVCIGPAPAARSYLDVERVLRAARLTRVDAIHPGYGFLSENADFAEAVEQAGLTLIGPSSHVTRLMGDKISARHEAQRHGIPCLPGSDGALPDNPEEILKVCEQVGYPLIVKASGGGGGRGMRVVRQAGELLSAIETAREEAGRAFGNSVVYAERFLEAPRHIEIQIIGDYFGNVVWLGARDCSVQRRHQKLIEEAPPVQINQQQLNELGEACAKACQAMGYVGAGTFEFLYEKGTFAFIEMNTRLQVEHPVTEITTGIDLVQEQICVAMGRPLSFRQQDIQTRGHAIECRINAENSENFLPAPGTVTAWNPPGGPGVRVDTHLQVGGRVTAHYDSLVAKLIVHGQSREDALRRMEAALGEARIEGIETLIPFHQRVLASAGFRAGAVSVHYLEALIEKDKVS